MSLKAFHFFFIIASVILSACFASWCFNNYEELGDPKLFAFGVGSIVSFVLLTGYLLWFLKKSQNISFFVFLGTLHLLGTEKAASACATCAGNPNHPMTIAANQGVWFLMMVITTILIGFAGIFIFWGVRSRRYNEIAFLNPE